MCSLILNEVISRRQTNCVKWDTLDTVYNVQSTDNMLAMWIADMDFAAPPIIQRAVAERLTHPIFGYSTVSSETIQAIQNWYQHYHQWIIPDKQMLFLPGVIPIIANIIECFTNVGDTIVVTPPVYPPFFQITRQKKRHVEFCHLQEQNGSYQLDLVRLEEAFQHSKLFILCNPHNPGGIVWSRSTLEKIVELAIAYDVVILSDEIHCDLVIHPALEHTPMLTVKDAEKAKIFAAIAPTKTFNIAGIQAAMLVSSTVENHCQIAEHAMSNGIHGLNVFADAVVAAVYRDGRPWLEEVLSYISENMDYAVDELSKIPGIRVTKSDATYLLWIDYRPLGIDEQQMMGKLLAAGLALDPGSKYGPQGEGFVRMNIATPRAIIEQAIQRFSAALAQQ